MKRDTVLVVAILALLWIATRKNSAPVIITTAAPPPAGTPADAPAPTQGTVPPPDGLNVIASTGFTDTGGNPINLVQLENGKLVVDNPFIA